jgi:hypothetical protein
MGASEKTSKVPQAKGHHTTRTEASELVLSGPPTLRSKRKRIEAARSMLK